MRTKGEIIKKIDLELNDIETDAEGIVSSVLSVRELLDELEEKL